jgi:hypothetical protein
MPWLVMVGGPPVVARFCICDMVVYVDVHESRLQQLEMSVFVILLALS